MLKLGTGGCCVGHPLKELVTGLHIQLRWGTVSTDDDGLFKSQHRCKCKWKVRDPVSFSVSLWPAGFTSRCSFPAKAFFHYQPQRLPNAALSLKIWIRCRSNGDKAESEKKDCILVNTLTEV